MNLEVKEKKEQCPACDGSGVQRNKDGLRVLCPVCYGTGKVERELDGTIKTTKIIW